MKRRLLSMRVLLVTIFLLGLMMLSETQSKIAQAQPASMPARTDVCGTITDSHWTLSGSPYVITCNSSLSSGSLAIDPGVSIRFQPGTQLDVSATLLAQGTQSSPITFTSNNSIPARGDWSGLFLHSGSSSSILRYVIVEYGMGVDVDHASPMIDNATIRYNAETGVHLQYSQSVISHSTIFSNTANSGAGIHVENDSATIDSNTIIWNSANTRGGGVHVYAYGGFNTVINNIISNNSVGGYGGAGILFDSANGLIANNTITDNVDNSPTVDIGCGGGVSIGGAARPTVTLQNNIIERNTSGYGSGGVCTDANTTIIGNLIANNVNGSVQHGALYYAFPFTPLLTYQ